MTVNGIENNAIILIRHGGILFNNGLISSRLASNDQGQVLWGDPNNIKIIDEGELVNQELGYIESFGSIANTGYVTNNGEIIGFDNTSISNTNGGTIDNRPNSRFNILNNSTLLNSDPKTLFSNFGYFSNDGAVHNSDGATLAISGYGSFVNGGTIYNERNAIISNEGVDSFTNNWKTNSSLNSGLLGARTSPAISLIL